MHYNVFHKYSNFIIIIIISSLFIINNLLSEDLYPVVKKNRVGYINRNGAIIIKPKFETSFQKAYILYQGKYYPFYQLPENAYFSEGKATFRQNWKILFIKFGYDFGVIDTLGNIVIPKKDIEFGTFHCNRSKITFFQNNLKSKNFKVEIQAFIDISGNKIDIESGNYSFVSDFSECLAIVMKDSKYTFIDTTGNVVFNTWFDDVSPFHNGTAAVKIDSLWGVIDKSGNLIIPPKYLRIWSKSDGFFRVFDGKNYSYINDNELNIFKNSYIVAEDFRQGFAAVKFGEFDYGFIDTLGNIAFKFDNCNGIGSFNSGLARVQIGEKWGYINTKGDFLIKPQYDYAIDFRDGFALVWLGKNVFIINTDGKQIWEYNFQERNEKN